MSASDILNEIETYLDKVDLAIEGKGDWPVPINFEGMSIVGDDPRVKARLKALLKRNEEAVAKVESRKKDLSLLIKRVSKRESSGPIAVDIRA